MLTILLPLLVAVLGVLMYALCTNPKLIEIGRILFFCGALVTVWVLSGMRLSL